MVGAFNQDSTPETRWEEEPTWGPFGEYEMFTWKGYGEFLEHYLYLKACAVFLPLLPVSLNAIDSLTL